MRLPRHVIAAAASLIDYDGSDKRVTESWARSALEEKAASPDQRVNSEVLDRVDQLGAQQIVGPIHHRNN